MARLVQTAMCCPCGATGGLWAHGLCRRCYDARRRSQTLFEGRREATLDRDGRCVLCASDSDLIVHHRSLHRYITLCRAHHARVHHVFRLRGFVSDLFRILWEEQNGRSRQLEFELVSAGQLAVPATEQQLLFLEH